VKNERGLVAIELPLAVGLFLVAAAVVIATAIAWVERLSIAGRAAGNAVTELVDADSLESGVAAADGAVSRVRHNYGLSDGHLELTEVPETFQRGATVEIGVTVSMPAVTVPFLGTIEGWSRTTYASARIDDYRSFG
jgi:hypothetical protein